MPRIVNSPLLELYPFIWSLTILVLSVNGSTRTKLEKTHTHITHTLHTHLVKMFT